MMNKPFIVPVFLPHSGCPHRCVFCNQTEITGKREHFPGSDALRAEIRIFLSHRGKKRGKTEISFYGGNFLGLEKRQITMCLDVAAEFVEKNAAQGIRFSTRPDTISAGTLNRIADYPVSTVEIGAQSMADTVLARSRRGHTAEDTEQAISELKKHPYRIGMQLMTGLPGDSAGLSKETARRSAELCPDFVRIYPALVIRGSPLAKCYRQMRYTPLTLKECVHRLKEMHEIFSSHCIPVIRMGLQATDGLSAGSVLAGPYHPSIGHMALAEIMREKAEEAIRRTRPSGPQIILRIHPGSYSRMQGLKNRNLEKLRETFNFSRIKLLPDSMIPELGVEVEDALP
ncbi:MAG: radical SAM protein [Desulfosalsimonadaceae bacterium]